MSKYESISQRVNRQAGGSLLALGLPALQYTISRPVGKYRRLLPVFKLYSYTRNCILESFVINIEDVEINSQSHIACNFFYINFCTSLVPKLAHTFVLFQHSCINTFNPSGAWAFLLYCFEPWRHGFIVWRIKLAIFLYSIQGYQVGRM